MNLPWVSRAHLNSAVERQEWAEIQQRVAEQRVEIARNELQALRADNKLLIDRILQMSGQPALFNPTTAPPAPEPKTSNLPAPQTRVGFDDVHGTVRKAIREGKLNLGVTK